MFVRCNAVLKNESSDTDSIQPMRNWCALMFGSCNVRASGCLGDFTFVIQVEVCELNAGVENLLEYQNQKSEK